MRTINIFFLTLALTAYSQFVHSQTKIVEKNADSVQNENTPASYTDLSIKDFKKIVDQEDLVIIDIRTPNETKSGVIKGCDLIIDFEAPNFATEIEKLDKSKTYVVYCYAGGRSSSAAQLMVDKGFSKIYNLWEGISRWKGPIVDAK